MKIIDIRYDDQDPKNEGWAYWVEGGESQPIDGQAADAIDRICENVEAQDGDRDAILDATGAEPGDQLWLSIGDQPRAIDLSAHLGLDLA